MIYFGGSPDSESDLCIGSNCHNECKSYSNLGCSYELPDGYYHSSDKSRSYLAGKYKFYVDEMEVF